MDILAGLGQGFAVALQPINLLYCFVGVVLAALAVGVFVVGLQLQLPIWPGQQ